MECCSDNAAVFNLGNSKPVKLGLPRADPEKRLGVKAKFKYQASNAEIKETCADVSKAHERGLPADDVDRVGPRPVHGLVQELDKRTRDEWAGGRFKAGRMRRR